MLENKTIAFLYKWIHIPTSKWYIGSRTAKGCHPEDGYVCSSKIVKPMILSDRSMWLRQILLIGDPSYIRSVEGSYLAVLDAKNDINSFNQDNGDGNFTTRGMILSDTTKLKMSLASKGKPKSSSHRANLSIANKKKANDPKITSKISNALRGKMLSEVHKMALCGPKSDSHRISMSLARKGKKTGPCSDSRKLAIQQALKGKHTLPLISCPHCGLIGRSNMRRWHFDNCKEKQRA